MDGTRGRLRSIPIGPDGRFRSDGVPVGRLAIRVAGPPLPATGNPGLDRFLFQIRRGHGLRRTIPAGGSAALDLDLEAEYRAGLGGEVRGRSDPRHVAPSLAAIVGKEGDSPGDPW